MSLKGSFASVLAHFHDVRSTPNGEQTATSINVGFVPIVLQKAKVTGLRIFRENTKAGRQEAIADSYGLNRATEVVSLARSDEVPAFLHENRTYSPQNF